MSTSNQRKAETLGMPGGTANNKLKKRLVYTLLQMLQEYQEKFGYIAEGFDENGKWTYPAHKWSLYCSVCGRNIQNEDEMTIEHIKPWEGRENGKDLFWDLENIGFSHKWCNKPHSYPGSPRPSLRKYSDEEKYCPSCDTMKLLKDFSVNASKPSLRENECRECRAKIRSGVCHGFGLKVPEIKDLEWKSKIDR